MTNLYVQLVFAYADHMAEVLGEAIKELCYGCSVDHPSQKEHDVCVMMEMEERVYHCYRKCLELVNEDYIMEAFTMGLTVSEILRCPPVVLQ